MKKLTPRQALKAFWTVFIFGAVIVLSGNSTIAVGNLRGSISVVIGTMLILIAGVFISAFIGARIVESILIEVR